MTKTTTRTTGVSPPSTAAQASLYQTLRGHLAVLKLDACAEALPRVLDEAAAEKLSVTATLERLFAIEVDTAQARRLVGRLRFACLPTPATLDDFDFDAQPGVDRQLINELGTCCYNETSDNPSACTFGRCTELGLESTLHQASRDWDAPVPPRQGPHSALRRPQLGLLDRIRPRCSPKSAR